MFSQACPLMNGDSDNGDERSNLGKSPQTPVEPNDFMLLTVVERTTSKSFHNQAKSYANETSGGDNNRFNPLASVSYFQLLCFVEMIPIISSVVSFELRKIGYCVCKEENLQV